MLGLLLFGDAFGVALLHGRDVALFTGHNFLFKEEVPDAVRALRAFSDPVVHAVFIQIERVRIRKWVVGSQDF